MNGRRVLTSAAELLVVLLVAVALPTSAQAQPEPRDFGVFADWLGQESSLEAEAFAPFNVYVVGFHLDGEPKGFEFSLQFPEEFLVLSITINPLQFPGVVLPDVRVGTGGCFPGDPQYNLMTVTVGYFVGDSISPDTLACLGPHSDPSTALNGRPGYLQCDGDWMPMGYAQSGGPHYPDGCLIINPTHPNELPVATESPRFGALKARYANP